MRMLATVFLLAQFAAAGPPQLPQAPPKTGTGLILGRVIDGGTSQPIAGALVQVLAMGAEPVSVFTSADGQFLLTSVPAGTLALLAAKPGYVRDGAHQHYDEGLKLITTEGERRGDLTVRLWKLGAITGTVTDERGEPVVGLMMGVAAEKWIAGHRRLGTDAFAAQTDDRGVYRIAKLPPGEYVIYTMLNRSSAPASLAGDKQAMENAGLWIDAPGGRNALRVGSSIVGGSDVLHPQLRGDGLYVYAPMFYPGATQATGAKPIAVKSGDEIEGIDFTLRPQRGLTVSGQVTGPDGPLSNLPVNLVPAGSADFDTEQGGPLNSTVTDAAGRFRFLGVTPGAYQVRALKGPHENHAADVVLIDGAADTGMVIAAESVPKPAVDPLRTEPTLYGNASVSVTDRSVDDVAIHVRRGVRLTGQLEFVGGKSPDAEALQNLRIIPAPADGRTLGWSLELYGWILPDGRFETVELPAGRYVLRTSDLRGWEFDATIWNGRDITDAPVDVGDTPLSGFAIRFATQTSQLSGSIGRSNDANVIVAVFPVDRARWVNHGEAPRFMKSATPDRNGTFSIQGLPAGDYFICAFSEVPFADWQSPQMLDQISRSAVRVSLAAAQQKSVNLTIARLR